MNIKTNNYYGTLYAGIIMNVNVQQLLYDLIRRYYNECKCPTTIKGPLCGYNIFENGLLKLIIENDVDIICLKCVYYFKSL